MSEHPAENRGYFGNRTVGLVVLFCVHFAMLALNALAAIVIPRYRKTLAFQWRYFLDVMRRETGDRKPGQ